MTGNRSIQPTIYAQFETRYERSPMDIAVRQVAFGAVPVDQLVSGSGMETDIAVTNSIDTAEEWLGKTKNTTIVVVYVYLDDRVRFQEFAATSPGRLHAIHVLGLDGSTALVPFLIQLIADKAKAAYEEHERGGSL